MEPLLQRHHNRVYLPKDFIRQGRFYPASQGGRTVPGVAVT